jgi:hypothetical protein
MAAPSTTDRNATAAARVLKNAILLLRKNFARDMSLHRRAKPFEKLESNKRDT